MFRNSVNPVVLLYGMFSSVADPLPGGVPTKVTVRVVSRDAKVIGSGVGGASVEIVNLETGELLARGVQTGDTGDTGRIMVRPRKRGQTVYGTPGAASFQAEIPLERPTRAEIRVKAPLSFPEALQSGTKTVTLLPGAAMEGEGIIVELDGLIVRIMHPAEGDILRSGEEVRVEAEVRMLCGCPFTPGGVWDSERLTTRGQWLAGGRVSEEFPLKYTGVASRFEGRTSAPAPEARLQVMAFDSAGNTGVHTRNLTIGR